jgi:archaellum component FlaG (FlaF/FlaG flagellin family)
MSKKNQKDFKVINDPQEMEEYLRPTKNTYAA